MIRILGWILGAVAAAGVLHLAASWMERRGWIYYRRGHGTASAIGNAVREAHAAVEPSVQYVIQEEKRERPEIEAPGDPPPVVPEGKSPTAASAPVRAAGQDTSAT